MNQTKQSATDYLNRTIGSLRRRTGRRKSRDAAILYSLAAFVSAFMLIEILVFRHLESSQVGNDHPMAKTMNFEASGNIAGNLPSHLLPKVPILPLFNSVDNADVHIKSLMEGRPSMAGVVSLLQRFISELHDKNVQRIKADDDGHKTIEDFYETARKYIQPFDNAYRGQHIFPTRTDESMFISLAAFREPLLTSTLVSAFKNAKNPEKTFIGAVVQNCFGKVLEDGTIDTTGKPCKTGPQDTGKKKKNGKAILEKMDAPPDENGVETFCALPDYRKYCDNGQIRVVYVHASDSLGPSMARYYASKLWGGENYFVQIDSHVRFASHWDAKYIAEIKSTRTYPKSVLSSYPPGFEQVRFIPKKWEIDRSKVNNETVIESPGCRLCNCRTPPGERNPIIHIKQGKNYNGNESRPTQTPFLGAGFILFRADLLSNVPYDPFLPWTFMGEEILFSMRVWTHGWNIYAPRKNLIIHQYRNGNSGFPKFQGAVNENAKTGFASNWLMKHTIRRIKNICGYPFDTTELIEADGHQFVLTEKEHYNLGSVRSWEEYMEFASLSVNRTSGFLDCNPSSWCNRGLKD